MGYWDSEPDPYTYEKIGTHYTGRAYYLVSLDSVQLGIIQPKRASTDTKIKGTRMRRQGRGRDEFQTYGAFYWESYPRRRDVADQLKRVPMTSVEMERARHLITLETARLSSNA